jgi:TolB-like protein/DNA-binding winged helix-turn-helix (wHTH) protein
MPQAPRRESLLHFGDFDADLSDRELLRNGARLRLQEQPFRVLALLLEQPDRLVTREEFQKRLWPTDTFVDFEAGLNTAVKKLREALGDSPAHPRYIETVPRQGYRFIASVAGPGESDQGQAAAHRPWRMPLATAAAAGGLILLAILLALNTGRLRTLGGPPAVQAIAVLPLANLSGGLEQEYFADGMTEELITELSQIRAWKVISRTSVMRYKATKKSLPEIARELSVDAVIEGTVLRAGGRVRVTVQLIDAATDVHLWSGSFEREERDVLSLQGEIAQSIAGQLHVSLAPQEHARLSRARQVVPEAYEAYLMGWHFFNRGQTQKAAAHFEQATIKDPGFALAHALLFETDALTTFALDQPLSERALRAMERASELDDSLAEVHSALGDVKFFGHWDWAAGEAEFRRAVELDPGSVDAAGHYASCLHALTRWDEALRESKRALQLDPLSPRMKLNLLRLFVDMHRYDLAIEQFPKLLDLEPNSAGAYALVASAYAALGREGEALAAWLQADRLSGKSADRVTALETAARAGGIRGYWRKRLEQLQEDAKQRDVAPLTFASLYARLGEADKAFPLLEAAFQQRVPRLAWIKAQSVWDPLRSDPRFQSLLRRMAFPE